MHSNRGRGASRLNLQATEMPPKSAKAGKNKQKPQDERREQSLQAVVGGLSCSVQKPMLIRGRFSPIPSKPALNHSHSNGLECVLFCGLDADKEPAYASDIVPNTAGKHTAD